LSSLGDFARAGLRPRTPLAKAIVFVLCLKLVLILSMQILLQFGGARPLVDESAVSRLIDPAPR
jgi:uncharacterized PurR-regulated membrane protein YhhQ (DUF165 family)